MIPYGKTKRGNTIHPHNECSVCSEQSFNKKTARQKSKQEIEMEVARQDEELVSKTSKAEIF